MGTRLEFNCSFPTSIPDSVRWKGEGQVGGGGGGWWVEGVPLLSPGPREPAISFNLSICSIGNVRMRDFANSIPRACVIFLFTLNVRLYLI